MKKILLATVTSLFIFATPVFATEGEITDFSVDRASKTYCNTIAAMDNAAKTLYGETLQWEQKLVNNRLMQFYANLETGTWTLFVVKPVADSSCTVSNGEGYFLNELNPNPTPSVPTSPEETNTKIPGKDI